MDNPKLQHKNDVFKVLKREMMSIIAERKGALENDITVLKADLAKAEHERSAQLKIELERLHVEANNCEKDLKNTGFFHFVKRHEVRAKFGEIKRHTEAVYSALQNIDSPEIHEIRKALDEKCNMLQIYSHGVDDWIYKLHIACDEYQRKYRFYSDYKSGKKMYVKSTLDPAEIPDFELKKEMYEAFLARGESRLSDIMEICPSLRRIFYPCNIPDAKQAVDIACALVKDGALEQNVRFNTMFFKPIEDPKIPLVDDTGWDIRRMPRKPNVEDFLPEI